MVHGYPHCSVTQCRKFRPRTSVQQRNSTAQGFPTAALKHASSCDFGTWARVPTNFASCHPPGQCWAMKQLKQQYWIVAEALGTFSGNRAPELSFSRQRMQAHTGTLACTHRRAQTKIHTYCWTAPAMRPAARTWAAGHLSIFCCSSATKGSRGPCAPVPAPPPALPAGAAALAACAAAACISGSSRPAGAGSMCCVYMRNCRRRGQCVTCVCVSLMYLRISCVGAHVSVLCMLVGIHV